MSEPYSLVVACQIAPDDLRKWLNGGVPAPDRYPDWTELDIQLFPDDYEPAFRESDRKPRAYLRDLRDVAMENYGWRFRHDGPSGQLNIVSLAFTQNWPEIIAGLTVLRSLAPLCPQGGYVLVHGFAFRQGQTACALSFTGGRSLFVHGPAVGGLVDHAGPLADHVLKRANAAFAADPPPPAAQVCTDQLDSFAGQP